MNVEEIRQQAQNENTAPKILTKLANSEDKITRQYVASNPNTPTDVLKQLVEEFPNEIAANPIFDLLLLENNESKIFLDRSIARNSRTTSDTLSVLSHNSNCIVRSAVALNFNTKPDVLSVLAKDLEPSVRHGVALNPNTPPYVLSIIAEDSVYFVRRRVAYNPNTPKDILAILVQEIKD